LCNLQYAILHLRAASQLLQPLITRNCDHLGLRNRLNALTRRRGNRAFNSIFTARANYRSCGPLQLYTARRTRNDTYSTVDHTCLNHTDSAYMHNLWHAFEIFVDLGFLIQSFYPHRFGSVNRFRFGCLRRLLSSRLGYNIRTVQYILNRIKGISYTQSPTFHIFVRLIIIGKPTNRHHS